MRERRRIFSQWNQLEGTGRSCSFKDLSLPKIGENSPTLALRYVPASGLDEPGHSNLHLDTYYVPGILLEGGRIDVTVRN